MVSTFLVAANIASNTQLENSPLIVKLENPSLITKMKKEKHITFYIFLTLSTIFVLTNLYEAFWKYKYSSPLYGISYDELQEIVPDIAVLKNFEIVFSNHPLDIYDAFFDLAKFHLLKNKFTNNSDREIIKNLIDNNTKFFNNYYRSMHAKICALLMSLVVILTGLNLTYTKAVMYQTILNVAIIFFAILMYKILLSYFKNRKSDLELDKVLKKVNMQKAVKDYIEIIKIRDNTEKATQQAENTFKESFDAAFSHKYMKPFALVNLAVLGVYTFISYKEKQERVVQSLPIHPIHFETVPTEI